MPTSAAHDSRGPREFNDFTSIGARAAPAVVLVAIQVQWLGA
jgi:hypothetical protein